MRRCEEKNTILDLLQARAERAPDAVAIRAPDRTSLTYSDLLRRVESVVSFLNSTGICRGDSVAVVLPNGPEMAVAFLGVAAGAVCAPMNPAYRSGEFEFYLSDLNAKALLVQTGSASAAVAAAEKLGIPVLELAPNGEEPAGAFALSDNRPAQTSREGIPQADDVALILHTSGTTSRAKRVPLTHINLLASAGNIASALQLTQADRCLNVMPLFHIHGLVGALLSSLAAGAGVICTSGFDGEQFLSWIETLAPTWYTAVPAIHQAILSRAEAGESRMIAERHFLRFIRSSSAPLPAPVMRRLEESFRVPVIEAYGMTEAAHQIASNPLPPLPRKPGSVGRPIGVEAAIIDEAGNFTAPGIIGEVVLRGASITRGYEGDAEANRNAFIDGWLRTGDLAQLDGDGYLFLAGRLKEAINRGGEKIAPLEIDKTLTDHPEIVEAVSFAVKHPSLGEDLVAAVVVRDKERASEGAIHEYLCGELAQCKVPSRILIVDKIPKSATGKVRRAGLAEIFAAELTTEFIPPRGGIESKIGDIYADVLGVDPVGKNDNFFTLGGDSLRASQVIARIRATFGINFTVATIFMKSTVAELAAEVLALMAVRKAPQAEYSDRL
jgi:acyl-CoA synthetase (AMP-forming)/AMP-acid ligase II/acyl carrier protein